MRIDVVFERNLWIKAAIEFEKRVTSTGIYGLVICKFSHWQEPYPFILFTMNEDSEVCLHCDVLPFGLVIGLRIESRRESFLNS